MIKIYSPKISEDLIPIIYQKAKKKKVSMTKYVDKLIRTQIIKEENKDVYKMSNRV